MGIIYVSGNILEAKTESVTNQVNCAGVMGMGLAKQFADKYPSMLKDYRDACRQNALYPGQIHIYELHRTSPPFYIFNFPTKDDWNLLSELEYIEEGLNTMIKVLSALDIKSISIPKLGCGLGGLNWNDVNLLIKKYLSDVGAEIKVYGEDT